MGELLDRTTALDATVHMTTYARKPAMFVSGSGMRLVDDEGREYLDFVSGIGAVNLGHAHPAVTAAICEQAAKLTHVSNLYYVEHRDELARDLTELLAGAEAAARAWNADGPVAGPDPSQWRIFFSNSGAEAVEGAIKLARRHGMVSKGSDCTNIVTAERSFHGRTLAALAATGQPSKQESFRPLPAGFSHVPLNDLAALTAAVDEHTCAVMLEPVQGEGGVYPCDPAYLRGVRELCDDRGILLILDEVQTGFYRTGAPFAFELFGVVPDVVCLAKAIANGLPMGAIAARGDAATVLKPGDHGSTFGGGPLVCAAARATLRALADERLGENAAASGVYLRDKLHEFAGATGRVADVRGAGLMNAVEFKDPIAGDIATAGLARGLVLNSIGTHILRILPPLVCATTEIDTLVAALYEMSAMGDDGGA
ncbi:MAG: aspartate aminotransferase family protein [Coriobacteriia bacterium]|nr:aspartate aminotransferase family protein [Coriobacteriia bacterium]